MTHDGHIFGRLPTQDNGHIMRRLPTEDDGHIVRRLPTMKYGNGSPGACVASEVHLRTETDEAMKDRPLPSAPASTLYVSMSQGGHPPPRARCNKTKREYSQLAVQLAFKHQVSSALT